MKRTLTALATTVALWGCVEANNPRRCDGKADFELTLSSPTGFPSNTQIEVTFGGGSTETFWLSAANDPAVLFCETTPALGSQAGEGGAGGSNTPDAGAGGGAAWAGGKSHGGAPPIGTNGSTIRAITCEIWSAGPATIMIRAGAWRTERELKPDPEICTLRKSVVLGEPDPKP